jgi:hypothetical protein
MRERPVDERYGGIGSFIMAFVSELAEPLKVFFPTSDSLAEMLVFSFMEQVMRAFRGSEMLPRAFGECAQALHSRQPRK